MKLRKYCWGCYVLYEDERKVQWIEDYNGPFFHNLKCDYDLGRSR